MEQLMKYKKNTIAPPMGRRNISISTISSNELALRRRRVDSDSTNDSYVRRYSAFERLRFPEYNENRQFIPRVRVNQPPTNPDGRRSEMASSSGHTQPDIIQSNMNRQNISEPEGLTVPPGRQYIPRVQTNTGSSGRGSHGDDRMSEVSSSGLSPSDIQQIVNGNFNLREEDDSVEYRWDFNVDRIDSMRRFKIQRPKILMESLTTDASRSSMSVSCKL